MFQTTNKIYMIHIMNCGFGISSFGGSKKIQPVSWRTLRGTAQPMGLSSHPSSSKRPEVTGLFGGWKNSETKMRDSSYTNFYPIFRNRGLQSTCFIIFQYTYTKLGKNHGTTRGLVRSLDWVSIPSFSHNGGKRWHMLELLRLKAPPRQESTYGTIMGKTTLKACSKPNHRANPCFFIVF